MEVGGANFSKPQQPEAGNREAHYWVDTVKNLLT
jgi:hypothetical protein